MAARQKTKKFFRAIDTTKRLLGQQTFVLGELPVSPEGCRVFRFLGAMLEKIQKACRNPEGFTMYPCYEKRSQQYKTRSKALWVLNTWLELSLSQICFHSVHSGA
jgi:hypothetical protein